MVRAEGLKLSGRLHDVSVSYEHGEFVHIIGANGAGKSSLLATLAGALDVEQGVVCWQGRDIGALTLSQLARYRCWLPQFVSTSFSLTVKEVMTLYLGDDMLAPEFEQALQIQPLRRRIFQQLSGGEQQRVLIALSLQSVKSQIDRQQALIIMDEPLQSLDLRFQHNVLQLLTEIAEKQNCVVISCHDVNLTFRHASRVTAMLKGQVMVNGDPNQVLTDDNLSRLYQTPLHVGLLNGHKICTTN